MGVHHVHDASSATGRWLHWTQAAAKAETELPKELPSQFHLEGPLLYSRSGSSEVKSGFFGTGGCCLLLGSKWNVVDDIVDLTHYSVSGLGCMVSLSSRREGQETFLRIYLGSEEEVQKWKAIMETASYLHVSDEYVSNLKKHVQKQCKAQKRRSFAASFGALTESICAPRHSVTGEQAKLRRSFSMRQLEGVEATYVGRFYLKSAWTEGKGRIYIHGDALILETVQRSEVKLLAIPLTGVSCTTASFMISVRGANGLAVLRLWVDNAEEAEELAQKIVEAGKKSAEMMQRKVLPAMSTSRRQLGKMAESLCNFGMQVPQKFRNNMVPKLSCWQRPQKKRIEQKEAYVLDGRCAILKAKSQEIQASHCVLRGDALWFGVKANACDQVISIVGATAMATHDMVMIQTRNGETHRLWPELGSGSSQQWCEAIQAAGKLAKDLGKWDAMKKSAFYQETAKEKVRKLARVRRFRTVEKFLTGLGAFAGMLCPERHSATEALLKWQEASMLPQEVKANEAAHPSANVNFFRRTDGGKAVPRTVEIRGDVMFVFKEGKMEKPVLLEGATIFVNMDKYPVVSIWREGVMQARMFMETDEEALGFGDTLEKAAMVMKKQVAERVEKTKSKEEVVEVVEKNEEVTEGNQAAPTMARSMSLSLKEVKVPAKLSEKEHNASQKAAQVRSRRFVASE